MSRNIIFVLMYHRHKLLHLIYIEIALITHTMDVSLTKSDLMLACKRVKHDVIRL
jgi:hypothetical protein